MRGTGTGLIETLRVRGGRLPLLDRHLARLERSLAELGLAPVSGDVEALDGALRTVGSGDAVVRLEVRDGRAEVTMRDVVQGSPAVMVTSVVHSPYPHKSTERAAFEDALAEARGAGMDDALLVTREGAVAEGTAWSLFWWDGDMLCTPAVGLGILPGVGRERVMELAPTREVRMPASALAGRSLFAVNAVRGIVPLASFQGRAVPEDARTAALSRGFWPD